MDKVTKLFSEVTLDDRKSKLRLAAPLGAKKARYVKEAIIELLTPIKEFVKTVTFDNGKEFTLHQSIANELECDTYFAKPYHSWERVAYYDNISQNKWNYSKLPWNRLSCQSTI